MAEFELGAFLLLVAADCLGTARPERVAPPITPVRESPPPHLLEAKSMEEFALVRPLRKNSEMTEELKRKKPTRPVRNSYPVGFSPTRRGTLQSGSISSESMAEDDLMWRAPRIHKSEEKKDVLTRILRKNVLMQHLSLESLSAVVDALRQVTVQPGEVVIHEGDVGDGSYLVEDGQLRVTMRSLGHRCDYGPVIAIQGDTFGEISLMYGNRRAATITALTQCELWKLDRDTFKKIVLNAMMPTHSAFEEYIKHVPLFGTHHPASLSEDEKDRIIKASQRLEFPKGAEMIREGNHSIEQYVFLIITGKVCIYRGRTQTYCKGPYEFFGDRTILWEEPAQASAIAQENTQVYRVPATVLRSLPDSILETLKTREVIV